MLASVLLWHMGFGLPYSPSIRHNSASLPLAYKLLEVIAARHDNAAEGGVEKVFVIAFPKKR